MDGWFGRCTQAEHFISSSAKGPQYFWEPPLCGWEHGNSFEYTHVLCMHLYVCTFGFLWYHHLMEMALQFDWKWKSGENSFGRSLNKVCMASNCWRWIFLSGSYSVGFDGWELKFKGNFKGCLSLRTALIGQSSYEEDDFPRKLSRNIAESKVLPIFPRNQ